MPPTNSLRPIDHARFGMPQARHLLNRAGFGGTPAQVAALEQMGLNAAVDYLVEYQHIDDSALPQPDFDPDIIRPPTAEERRQMAQARRDKDEAALDRLRFERLQRQAEDREQMGRLANWWLARMIQTPRPLEEKLTLLWHGHFATNHRTIQDSFLMLQQNRFFRTHASGSFAELAHGIVRDPAMIRFLNNDTNNRRKPNENLARELMELFTLGVGHYSEQDIKEGARALTGNGVEDNDFRFRPAVHDGGAKTILGKSGAFKGEDFVQVLLEQRQCAAFVAWKLYKHFVADVSDQPDQVAQGVINQLASVLRDSRYQLKPALKVLFKSEHFYDPAIAGNQIKSPVQLLVGTLRTLNTPARNLAILGDALGMMGQKLFDPPSVAGWDGGRSWINTSTLFVRQNLCAYLISGKLPAEGSWSRADIDYEPEFLLEGVAARTPAAVTEHLLATLLPPPVPPQRREQLLALKPAGEVKPDTVIAMLMLITAMPEYQLC